MNYLDYDTPQYLQLTYTIIIIIPPNKGYRKSQTITIYYTANFLNTKILLEKKCPYILRFQHHQDLQGKNEDFSPILV